MLTNSLGMKLALVPAGKFWMGSPPTERLRNPDEGPGNEVTISKPFYLGIHEVTVGNFRAFVKDTNYQTDAERTRQGRFAISPRRRSFWRTRSVPGTIPAGSKRTIIPWCVSAGTTPGPFANG